MILAFLWESKPYHAKINIKILINLHWVEFLFQKYIEKTTTNKTELSSFAFAS